MKTGGGPESKKKASLFLGPLSTEKKSGKASASLRVKSRKEGELRKRKVKGDKWERWRRRNARNWGGGGGVFTKKE